MNSPSDTTRPLLHRLGVAGPARVRACKGTGAPFAFLLALGVLALAPALASANGAHGFEGTTLGSGEKGEGADELELVAPIRDAEGGPAFRIAGSGVAVNDATHDVYVADTGNHRISEFEADGTFVRAFGANVGGPGIDTCTLVPGCSAGTSGSAPGELSAPKFVAVDQSSGDVYVGDGVGEEAANELQHLEFSDEASGATSYGLPSGGTYTLTYEGHTTKGIPYSPSCGAGEGCAEYNGPDAKSAQQALGELPSLDGNVKVREKKNNNAEVTGLTVEFIGALAETAVPKLTGDASGLTPAGATIEVSTEREGSTFAAEVISKFTAEGALISSWGDSTPTPNGQLTGKNAAEGPFAGMLGGLAVDSSGDLWVLSTGGTPLGTFHKQYLYEFEADGAYKEPTQSLESTSASGLAVDDSGNLYLAGQVADCVEEVGKGCVSGKHDSDPTGFALDRATGHVFVGLGDSIENADSSCVPSESCEMFGAPQLQGGAGVAVDASTGEPPLSGTVYAANTVTDVVDVFPSLFSAETDPASEVTAAGMTLHGTVDPEGSEVSECYFEYGTSSEYEHTVECEESPQAIGHGVSEVPVQAKIAGLRGGTTYHFRLVARKGALTLDGIDLTTPTPTVPVIADAEALNVAAGSAELRATVDPEGLPISRCELEYGTTTAYGHVVRCEQKLAQLGFGVEPVPVSARIAGLEANTTYHWRLSVRDANGEAYGADHVFVYPTESVELPDNRAYEMVSPPFKNGAAFGLIFAGPTYDISEDGSRVIADSIQCLPGSLSCTAQRDGIEGEPFEFTRTPSGWVTTALTPPATQFSENNVSLIGAGEGMALFSMPASSGGESDWYVRQPDGSFADVGPESPPAAGPTVLGNDKGVVATADFSHLVWESKDQWPFAGGDRQVVEYAGVGNSQPLLVGVDDEGQPIGGCATYLGGLVEAPYPLSADGRTVYFTVEGHDEPAGIEEAACSSSVPAPPVGELYARIDGELPDAHTVAVSQPQCGVGAAADEVECRKASPGDAAFIGASEDGSRAFFLDTGQLTPAATQGTGTAVTSHCSSGSECNLYEYDFNEPAGHNLIDVSAGDTSGLGPQVQYVFATSADGSHVYFLANGVLAPGARPGHCSGETGTCNLYVYERDARYPEGHIAFIASVTASYNDSSSPEDRKANVTPEGRFLVFPSSGDLTPDDTRGDGAVQIFRYDADQSVREEGENVPALVRISVGDDGYNDDGNGGVGDATIVPESEGKSVLDNAEPDRGDPTMSNDGAYVFFQSPVGLTPHAQNDVLIGQQEIGEKGEHQVEYAENVYEWEAPGTEADGKVACAQASGCVYLISDGRDVSATGLGPCSGRVHTPSEIFYSDSCLYGTDASGHNVFFTTSDRLVPEDTDTQVDIYDARICEPDNGNPCIQPALAPLPPCLGEQCHGIPEPTPSLLAPGTASFNGEGNITQSPPAVKKVTKKAAKQCKKVVVKKKGKKKTECVKKKSKKKSKQKAKKAKRANHDRRAR